MKIKPNIDLNWIYQLEFVNKSWITKQNTDGICGLVSLNKSKRWLYAFANDGQGLEVNYSLTSKFAAENSQ